VSRAHLLPFIVGGEHISNPDHKSESKKPLMCILSGEEHFYCRFNNFDGVKRGHPRGTRNHFGELLVKAREHKKSAKLLCWR
jgi:hypothetical protein